MTFEQGGPAIRRRAPPPPLATTGAAPRAEHAADTPSNARTGANNPRRDWPSPHRARAGSPFRRNGATNCHRRRRYHQPPPPPPPCRRHRRRRCRRRQATAMSPATAIGATAAAAATTTSATTCTSAPHCRRPRGADRRCTASPCPATGATKLLSARTTQLSDDEPENNRTEATERALVPTDLSGGSCGSTRRARPLKCALVLDGRRALLGRGRLRREGSG